MGVRAIAAAMLVTVAGAAEGQDTDTRPRRTRVAIGPQLVPSYPGSDKVSVVPYFDLSRARGDDPFVFEAPDENAGFNLWDKHGFSIGPAFNFEGSRTARDVGAAVPKVGFTVEAGGFAQYWVTSSVRLRGELRQGVGGHKALIGLVSADYVARDRDRWLFSLGPRLTVASSKYERAYFGVTPSTAVVTGLPAFRPGGFAQAVGGASGLTFQITPRWGIMSYAKYDRIIGDAARSPLTRLFGSRDQWSGGLALSYTFGKEITR